MIEPFLYVPAVWSKTWLETIISPGFVNDFMPAHIPVIAMTTGRYSIIDVVAIAAAGIGPMSIGSTAATVIARFFVLLSPNCSEFHFLLLLQIQCQSNF